VAAFEAAGAGVDFEEEFSSRSSLSSLSLVGWVKPSTQRSQSFGSSASPFEVATALSASTMPGSIMPMQRTALAVNATPAPISRKERACS